MVRMMQQSAPPALTHERVARLYQFVKLLGSGPKPRSFLIKRLNVEPRGFFRDFQKMRAFGVAIEMHEGRYVLLESVSEALARLPFPDPGLSVQEVILLARGRTAAHRKLRAMLNQLLGNES